MVEGSFRDVAGKDHYQHREQAEVHLVHFGVFCSRRKIALGSVDLVPYILQSSIGIEAGLEFEQHIAPALVTGRAHLLDALDNSQLLLQRTYDQAFRVFR